MKLASILSVLVFMTTLQSLARDVLPATTLDLRFTESIVDVSKMQAKVRFAHVCRIGVLFTATGDLLNCGFTETIVKADRDGKIRIPGLPSPSRYETVMIMNWESRYEVSIQFTELLDTGKVRELFYMKVINQDIFSFNQNYHNVPIWVRN